MNERVFVVDRAGVASIKSLGWHKDRREKSAIAHITIDGRGRCFCERCGESYRCPDRDVISGNTQAMKCWMQEHRDCRPAAYVS